MQTIDRRKFNSGLFLGFGLAGCAQLEPGQPDLVVTAIRWSEDDGATWHTGPIQAGSDVLFECDVRNQGSDPTPDGVIIGVAFRANGITRAWSDHHTASLPSGATVSLQANGGPDGDEYWNNAQAGSYTIRAHVDDINRIPNELDETNNTLDVPVTVEGVADAPTIGDLNGGGGFLFTDYVNNQFMYQDLLNMNCKSFRLSLYPAGYWNNGAPDAADVNTSGSIVYALQRGLNIYIIFEFYSFYPVSPLNPARNYADWFAIGAAFAARYRPNSAYLISQGITNAGITQYSAINEPDQPAAEDPNLTYAQYHAMLEGLADGVHSQHAESKVFPAGYLSANRNAEFTGFGYLSTVADLINDGTLAGFDLHTYHNKPFAPIHDRYTRSHQRHFERCITDSGITRTDIDWVCTEHNITGIPYAVGADYDGTYPGSGLTDEQVARNWFLTHFFDINGVVRSDGSKAGGVRLAWSLWQQSDQSYWFTQQNNTRIERQCGITFSMLMGLLHDMHFTSNDPKVTGVHKLRGGGKSAWVFQNIHSSWSTLFGDTFTISDIPAGTTQVQVYDGNGLIQTVSTPTLQIPSHTFSTPRYSGGTLGKSWLFIGNAE